MFFCGLACSQIIIEIVSKLVVDSSFEPNTSAMNAETVETVVTFVVVMVIFLPVVILFFMLIIPSECDCETWWKMIPYGTLKVLLIFVVFAAIAIVVALKGAREFFLDNFEKYRCKPWFLPFVSWVNPTIGVQENFEKCNSATSSITYAVLSTPLLNVTQTIGSGLNETEEAVAQASKGMAVMADAVGQSLERKFEEVGKYQAISIYLFLKVKAIFDKMMALIFNFYYGLVILVDFIDIVLNMPEIMLNAFGMMLMIAVLVSAFILAVMIGLYVAGAISLANPFGGWAIAASFFAKAAIFSSALVMMMAFIVLFASVYAPVKAMFDKADSASFCCFHPSSEMVMADGRSTRPIAELQPGDVLQRGVRVLGVLRVRSHATDWYEVNTCSATTPPTVVSGNHEMWCTVEQKWRCVRDLADDVKRAAATGWERGSGALVHANGPESAGRQLAGAMEGHWRT